MNDNTDNAYYVYGFTEAGLVPTPVGTPPPKGIAKPEEPAIQAILHRGIDEQHAPIFQIFGKVAAVLNVVSQADFCGSAGEANLQDLAWLAPRACRHQAVIEQVMRLGPVLPARFGTLFSSLAKLEAYLREHEEAISRFLERVRGHDEWAVKGLLDPTRAEAELLARARAGKDISSNATPGLAYMQEQRLLTKVKQELADRLAEVSNGLFEELCSLVSAVCERRILSREATGEEGDMVSNWAFLVPHAALADFRGRIEHANTERKLGGLTFELSGPWPPYSFDPGLEPEANPSVDMVEDR